MAPIHKARGGPSTPVTAAPAPRDLTPAQVSVQKAATKAGQAITKTVTAYQPPNNIPVIYDRNLTEVKGERHARRPSSLTNSADMLCPASAFLQQLAEHELVDMGAVALKQKRAKRGARGPESKKRVSRQCGKYRNAVTHAKLR